MTITDDISLDFPESIPNEATSDIALRLPRIWWGLGRKLDKKTQTAGYFWTVGRECPIPPAEPWQPDPDRFPDDLSYVAPTLHIAVIAERAQAYKDVDRVDEMSGQPMIGDNGEPEKEPYYLDKWEPGAKFYTEVLCFAQGFEDMPVIWASKGLTSQAWAKNILPGYQHGLLATAMRHHRRKLPLGAFWLPIGPRVDANGNLAFTETKQKGLFNVPQLYYEADLNANQLMQKYYVGRELLDMIIELRLQYATWRDERRPTGRFSDNARLSLPDGGGDEHETRVTSNGNGRKNTPVPVEDGEDIPF